MKKIILAISFSLLSVSAFSLTGVGVAFTFGLDTGAGGAALNLSSPSIPGTILGINADFREGSTSIALYDDWWMHTQNIGGPIDLYLGPGFFLGLAMTENGDKTDTNFSAGARLPIGLRFFPIKPMELFLELAPSIAPINNSGISIGGDSVFFQGAFGVRLWF